MQLYFKSYYLIHLIFRLIHLKYKSYPKKYSTLRVKIKLRVIAMKRYCALPKAPGLEPHHQLEFSVIPFLGVGFYPSARDTYFLKSLLTGRVKLSHNVLDIKSARLRWRKEAHISKSDPCYILKCDQNDFKILCRKLLFLEQNQVLSLFLKNIQSKRNSCLLAIN